MPRLLIPIVSAMRGGAEEYAAAIAAGAGARYDVHVLVPDVPAMTAFADEVAQMGVTVDRAAIGEAGVRAQRRFRGVRGRRAIAAVAPDVVLLPLPGMRYGLDLMRACVEFSIPCFPVYQLLRWEQWTPRLGEELQALLAHPLIQPITVSEYDRSNLLERVDVPPERVHVVHNGIDLDRFALSDEQRDEQRVALRSALNLAGEATVCLGVGRLHEQKGCDLLIAALPKLLRARPELHVCWAGEGPMREGLLHMARVMGIEGHAHLLGRRTDVPQLLAAADVFVFPSRFEGFPFALLEAMAAGVPVVAADIPAVREAAGDGVVRLVPPDDIYHLRRGMAEVLAQREEARARAKTGVQRVQAFSLAAMCRRTLDAIGGVEAPAHA